MVFDNRPSFFRNYIPQLMAQNLKIPYEFVERFQEAAASRAILTGPSGVPWTVKLLKIGEAVYFGDGWKGFVRDNLLEEFDLFIFKYDGDMQFTVEIFRKSGVIRQPEDATIGSGGGLKRGKRQFDDNGRGKNRLSPPEVHRNKSTKLQNKLASESNSGERAVAPMKRGTNSFSAQFPFFKITMKHYNVGPCSYMMYIPKTFTDKHFVKQKNNVILRSMKGKAWEVNYRDYDGKFSLGKGWRNFVEDNKLKVGDVCIFELVGEMELQFHVLSK